MTQPPVTSTPLDTELTAAMHHLCAIGGTSPSSHYTQLPEGSIHHLQLGEPSEPSGPGERPPLVLVHGASGGAANWFRMFGHLSKNHRILAPDLPGFGLSDRRPLNPPLGTQSAHTLRDWLDALGIDRVRMVGTSFGGLAAVRFAQHFPARVERLVMIDAAGATGEPHPLVGLSNLVVAPIVMRPTRRGTRWLLRTVLMRTRLPLDVENALVEYLYLSAVRTTASHMVKAMRLFNRGERDGTWLRPVARFEDKRSESPTSLELSAITAPTLIVWGVQDRFFKPADAAAWAIRLPNAARVLIDNAGHSPNWDQPEALAAALQQFFGAEP